MRRAARIDPAQPEIVAALRNDGVRIRRKGVYDLSTPQGRHKARKAGLDVPLQIPKGVEWTCAGGCGKTERRPPTKAAKLMCSKCRFASYAGSGNPNFSNASERTCANCGDKFKSYQKAIRYCSQKCYRATPRPQRTQSSMKYGGRRDHNHNEIVEALKTLGVSVIDTSHVGRGFPDLIVGYANQTLMMEIKNPKTAYGRMGLSDSQKRWKEGWMGGPYAMVSSVHGAVSAVRTLCGGPVATVTDVEGAIRAVTFGTV